MCRTARKRDIVQQVRFHVGHNPIVHTISPLSLVIDTIGVRRHGQTATHKRAAPCSPSPASKAQVTSQEDGNTPGAIPSKTSVFRQSFRHGLMAQIIETSSHSRNLIRSRGDPQACQPSQDHMQLRALDVELSGRVPVSSQHFSVLDPGFRASYSVVLTSSPHILTGSEIHCCLDAVHCG